MMGADGSIRPRDDALLGRFGELDCAGLGVKDQTSWLLRLEFHSGKGGRTYGRSIRRRKMVRKCVVTLSMERTEWLCGGLRGLVGISFVASIGPCVVLPLDVHIRNLDSEISRNRVLVY